MKELVAEIEPFQELMAKEWTLFAQGGHPFVKGEMSGIRHYLADYNTKLYPMVDWGAVRSLKGWLRVVEGGERVNVGEMPPVAVLPTRS